MQKIKDTSTSELIHSEQGIFFSTQVANPLGNKYHIALLRYITKIVFYTRPHLPVDKSDKHNSAPQVPPCWDPDMADYIKWIDLYHHLHACLWTFEL